jgi:hypothetical protein
MLKRDENVFGIKELNENRFNSIGKIQEMNSKYRNTSPSSCPNLALMAAFERSKFIIP